jgi:hypothetical protein
VSSHKPKNTSSNTTSAHTSWGRARPPRRGEASGQVEPLSYLSALLPRKPSEQTSNRWGEAERRRVAVQDEAWRPSITVCQVLVGIQALLAEPNDRSPAQAPAYMFFTKRRDTYQHLVLLQAQKYAL